MIEKTCNTNIGRVKFFKYFEAGASLLSLFSSKKSFTSLFPVIFFLYLVRTLNIQSLTNLSYFSSTLSNKATKSFQEFGGTDVTAAVVSRSVVSFKPLALIEEDIFFSFCARMV